MSVTGTKKQTNASIPVPKTHHLDKRAHALIELDAEGNPQELLETRVVAEWLAVSHQWLEIGRCKGYGPPFVQLSPRVVRYRRLEVIAWLNERVRACTAEYGHRPSDDESAEG